MDNKGSNSDNAMGKGEHALTPHEANYAEAPSKYVYMSYLIPLASARTFRTMFALWSSMFRSEKELSRAELS